MAKPNFTLPNKPAIKSGSILSYNYTDDFTFVPAPLTFNRDSAATRVNEKGLIEDVGYFGPELVQNGDFSEIGSEEVVNGDFSDSSWWGLDPVWSISNGSANCNGSGVIYKGGVLTIGKTYKVEVEISSYTSGTLTYPNAPYTLPSVVGSYTFYYKANSQTVSFTGTNFIGSIDNVSVKEVGQNWSFGTGWSMGDGKAIRTAQSGSTSTYQSISFSANKTYKIQYDLDITAGSFKIRISGGTLVDTPARTTSGTYTEYIVANSGNNVLNLRANDGAFVGSITNISVQEIQTDTPRIDFSDTSKGALLLEPQSTNLVTYSEDFSQWNNTDITIGENGISPTGETNANLIQTGTANSDQVNETFTISATNTATYSIFIKRVSGAEWVDFLVVKSGFSNSLKVWFNISSGLVGSNVANGTTTFDSASVKDFGNGWYRLKVTTTDTTNNTSFNIRVRTASADASDTRVSNSSYYLWGAQLEQLSYASSYIPTAGSTVTRAQETCNNAGNVSTFNSTEGVLYAEIASLTTSASSGERRIVVAKNGDTNNVVRIYYNNTANTIQYKVRVASSNVCDLTYDLGNSTGYHKICGKWKQNDFALWVDGVKVATDTSGSVFPANTLNTLNFSNANANSDYFYGKTKGVYVFNEALTDDELQQLTGPEYNSFAALAAAYNYTVI